MDKPRDQKWLLGMAHFLCVLPLEASFKRLQVPSLNSPNKIFTVHQIGEPTVGSTIVLPQSNAS